MKICKMILIITLLAPGLLFAKEYSIFNISQSFPMTESKDKVKKNFYLNMGQNQGLSKGVVVDVTRSIARTDPYDNDTRFEFKIKVGELKVVHVEAEAAIAKFHKLEEGEDQPYLEIDNFMIGDEVKIHVK